MFVSQLPPDSLNSEPKSLIPGDWPRITWKSSGTNITSSFSSNISPAPIGSENYFCPSWGCSYFISRSLIAVISQIRRTPTSSTWFLNLNHIPLRGLLSNCDTQLGRWRQVSEFTKRVRNLQRPKFPTTTKDVVNPNTHLIPGFSWTR